MVRKKYLLFFSALTSIVLVFLDFLGTDKICGGRQYTMCMQSVHSYFIVLQPVFFLLIFSLITYWMREDEYRAWFKFARWWIPLSMILILISPEYSHDWMYRIEKGTVAFATSLLFVVISIIIVIKLIAARKTTR